MRVRAGVRHLAVVVKVRERGKGTHYVSEGPKSVEVQRMACTTGDKSHVPNSERGDFWVSA